MSELTEAQRTLMDHLRNLQALFDRLEPSHSARERITARIEECKEEMKKEDVG